MLHILRLGKRPPLTVLRVSRAVCTAGGKTRPVKTMSHTAPCSPNASAPSFIVLLCFRRSLDGNSVQRNGLKGHFRNDRVHTAVQARSSANAGKGRDRCKGTAARMGHEGQVQGGALGFQAWVATERGLDRYGSMGKGRGVNKARHAKHKVICLCREVAESPCVLRGSRVSKICKP